MTRELLCINCPMGCRMQVTITDGSVTEVQGNLCGKGEAYAGQEAVEPLRMITSLMRCENRDKPLSVRTTRPVPKRLYFDCVEIILRERPVAPVTAGSVVIADILGTGADVVATRTLT